MNYPGGIKIKNISKEINYKNRGMTLENDINKTNEYYKEIEKAYIYKKPTPIKIVKVDYPSREKAIIKEAYFTIPSTTDYNGLYKGKYIDFEAKETISKTSFSLSNIHKHQIKHLDNIDKNGGISFIIIEYVNNATRKSIPIDFFEKKAYILNDTYRPPIDYLKVVDYIIGGNNGKEN